MFTERPDFLKKLILVPETIAKETGIPKLVKIRSIVTIIGNLHGVPTPIAMIADVQRLVEILEEVDDVPERHSPTCERRITIEKNAAEFLVSAHDAIPMTVARVIGFFRDMHVDVVP